ncbi:GFA family protein [Sphingomonas solaris]|uniref:GFA family protein n=1 Tax=Alterirhizorhabdus solaris TaxID=2529389 RepID=UPI001EEF9BDC|nr:hypothetical protein [Sphingomonas solaris]
MNRTICEPDHYAASPIARRGFCARCGTTLSFDYPDSGNIDLAVASFDDPRRFVPTEHVGIESRLAHWRDTADLPGYRSDENTPLTERWMKTVGKLPD